MRYLLPGNQPPVGIDRRSFAHELWHVPGEHHRTERYSHPDGAPIIGNAFVRIPAIALTTFLITYLVVKLLSLRVLNSSLFVEYISGFGFLPGRISEET